MLRRAVLTSHPSSPSSAVQRIEVGVSAAANGVLTLSYALAADMKRVRIPQVGPHRRADQLWQHTCFEVFARAGAAAAYLEFNFAPSTEWAAYVFSGYRAGMSPIEEEEYAPIVAVRAADRGFELDATVRLTSATHLALAAVIEEDDGRLSYWALKHPGDKPDFHHPGGFILDLMNFGIDRLLAEPALAKPLAGRRVALLAHPASVTAISRIRSMRSPRCGDLEAHRGLRPAARPARRQAGQHGRVAGLPRSGARHPGVQPVRQGAPAHAGDDGHLRRAAGRPAGRRLPHLHLHHHAALCARSGGEARQGGLGARPPESRRAGRSKG